MSETKHSPLPWRTTKSQPHIICNDGGNKWIARALIGSSRSPRFIADHDIADANAAFIVTAVNSLASLQEENEALKARIAELEAENTDLKDQLGDPEGVIAHSDAIIAMSGKVELENEALRRRLEVGPHGEDALDVADSAMEHAAHRISYLEGVLRLVASYDDLLLQFEGPADGTLFAGDVPKIDAAYDEMVAAARAALQGGQGNG